MTAAYASACCSTPQSLLPPRSPAASVLATLPALLPKPLSEQLLKLQFWARGAPGEERGRDAQFDGGNGQPLQIDQQQGSGRTANEPHGI